MGANASHQAVEFPSGAKATSLYEVAEYYEDDGAYYYDSMSPIRVKGRKQKGEKFLDVTVYKLPTLSGKVERLEMMIGSTECTVYGPIERNCLCLVLENHEQELARHELMLDLRVESSYKHLVNLGHSDPVVGKSRSGCWYRLVVHTEFASEKDLVFSQSYFSLTMSSLEVSLHGGRNLPLSLPFEEKLVAPNVVCLQSHRPWSWKPSLDRQCVWWTETPVLTAGISELEVNLDWRIEGSELCEASLDLLLVRKGRCIQSLRLLSVSNSDSRKTCGHVRAHFDTHSASAMPFLSQCKPDDRLVLARGFVRLGGLSNNQHHASGQISPRIPRITPRCVVSNVTLVCTSNEAAKPCWAPVRLLPDPLTIAPELLFLFPTHRSAKATREESSVRSFSAPTAEDPVTEDLTQSVDSNQDGARLLTNSFSHYSAVTTVATDWGGGEEGDCPMADDWTGATCFQQSETPVSHSARCWAW